MRTGVIYYQILKMVEKPVSLEEISIAIYRRPMNRSIYDTIRQHIYKARRNGFNVIYDKHRQTYEIKRQGSEADTAIGTL